MSPRYAPADDSPSPSTRGHVLGILRGGIDLTLLGTGHSSIHDVTAEGLIASDSLHRKFGI